MEKLKKQGNKEAKEKKEMDNWVNLTQDIVCQGGIWGQMKWSWGGALTQKVGMGDVRP